MILYKLTDENGQTYGKTQWGEGITHSGTGEGELCGPGFIHAYESPLLAVLLNPIHAAFKNPRLWVAEGEIVKNDRGLKCGCVSLTTIKELRLPEITDEMRVKFAILCAKNTYNNVDWNRWADSWLYSADRSSGAAEAAARAARAATWAARAARTAWAAEAATWAARAAARAARAATWAARAARTAWAAEAAWAARAAARAAPTAEAAAEAAARAAARAAGNKKLNLIRLAEEACNNVI